jgi:hypothetical protein
VVETILELRCPGCKRVFIDFQPGVCFALNCAGADHRGREYGCRNNFCAYCLESCGKDGPGSAVAHRHVANCQHNIAPGKDIFGQPDPVRFFEQAQRERRTRMLRAFVARQQPEVRAPLLAALAQDLRDLGMRPGDFA